MDRNTFLDQTLDALTYATSREDLLPVIYSMRDQYGLTNITYRSLLPKGTDRVGSETVISTSDPEWFRQYETQGFIDIDPIVNSAWRAALPLDWDHVDRRSRTARFYFSEMARFKIGDRGLSIPLSPPNGRPGLFTFIAAGLSDSEWKALRRRCEADMIFLGQHIHFHALRVDQTQRKDVLLTERGRVCLELVLNGHKPSPIGKLLGLSVHTVRMHLRHAQERLHCQSLPEAVGKALELGLIKKYARLLLFGMLTELAQSTFVIDAVSLISA